MDFNQLMQRMRDLDQPVGETAVPECGEPMGMTPPGMPPKADTPPPSMSVNLNAQGLDDISELMKLMTKVNPDMINQPSMPPLPSMGGEPSIMSIKPELPALKMLPDLDSDNDDAPGGEMDMDVKGLDQDGDGDHDMGDHDMEKKDKEEAFGNSLNGSEPDYKGLDAAIPDGDDLNRPKKSFSGKPYRGDNPMAANAYESKEGLRASIRAELLQRLAEAKSK